MDDPHDPMLPPITDNRGEFMYDNCHDDLPHKPTVIVLVIISALLVCVIIALWLSGLLFA